MRRARIFRRIVISSLLMALVVSSIALSIAHLSSTLSHVIVADGPPGTAGDGNGRAERISIV
jgi:hypothetical protein